MTIELTPQQWEHKICEVLARSSPVRSRWVQEHPKRTKIVFEMVEDARDLLEEANDPEPGTSSAHFWMSIPPAERPDEVAALIVEAEDMWQVLTRTWPNPPPAAEAPLPPPLPGSIPASAPTRRGWFRPG